MCDFLQFFTPYESVLGVDDRSEIFFQYLNGRCHGNQFSGKNEAKLPTPCTYRSVNPKRNGISLPQCVNVRINSVNDASMLCNNLVDFGPVTPEKTGLICVPFLRHGKKLAYLVKYLRIYWTDFYNLFTI